MYRIKDILIFAAVVASLMLASPATAEDEPTALDRIRERGVLEVAVYNDFPPFSYRDERGRIVGIDADIAHALAKSLGVAAAIRAVGADESMEDDLRNNVWKGHYLGGGVADVMLHVPYDAAFAEENDRVIFVAPYYREQVVVTVEKGVGANLDPLDYFSREKVGVELDTLTDFYLLSAYNGKIRNQVVHFSNIGKAVTALKNGEVAGVAGPRSEIEFALGDQAANYAVGPIQMPGLSTSGWDLGAAVKQGNGALAEAVEQAMSQLRQSSSLSKIFTQYRSTYQLPSRTRLVRVESDGRISQRD
ncbi:MAG: transporter substrate-binding domain-containing protein [Candidatus Thiodiazotropha endolucinida]